MSENLNSAPLKRKNGRIAKAAPVLPPQCEEVQGLIFDYMARELGGARSDFVREHLRKCDACRRTAADMQRTLDALQQTARQPGATHGKLSSDRRARLMRAARHPVLEWVTAHHVLVSVVAAAIAFCLAFWLVRNLHLERDEGKDAGPEVIIDPRHAPEGAGP